MQDAMLMGVYMDAIGNIDWYKPPLSLGMIPHSESTFIPIIQVYVNTATVMSPVCHTSRPNIKDAPPSERHSMKSPLRQLKSLPSFCLESRLGPLPAHVCDLTCCDGSRPTKSGGWGFWGGGGVGRGLTHLLPLPPTTTPG